MEPNTNQFLMKMGFGPVVPIFPTKSRVVVKDCVLKIVDIPGERPSYLRGILRSEAREYQAALYVYNELIKINSRLHHPHPGGVVISFN